MTCLARSFRSRSAFVLGSALAAAFVLTLVKSIMILKGVDQNWAQVIQGTLIVLVVMIGGLALRQRGKNL